MPLPDDENITRRKGNEASQKAIQPLNAVNVPPVEFIR